MKYELTYKAPEKLRGLTLDQLLNAWESTEFLHTPETPIVRGWLMDELERRNPEAFSAWLDQDAPEDSQLRQYIIVNRMCLTCSKLGNGCMGTTCQTWTGCIYKTIQ